MRTLLGLAALFFVPLFLAFALTTAAAGGPRKAPIMVYCSRTL